MPSYGTFIGSLIPAGEFEMGFPDVGSTSRLPAETPVHRVKLTKPYFMSACEITNDQFLNITENMQSPANDNHKESGNFPVTNISWDEANSFCERLSLRAEENRAGRSYRLPTEAEWEYACRSGKSVPYSWSESRLPDDESGEAAGIEPPLPLTQVGTYSANSFGLFDMRGNAWEWTSDWYQRDYYSHSSEVNPTGPTTGIFKVIRGSDWRFVGEKCFIDYPTMPPWKTNPIVGFRVVCEIDK